MIDAKTKYIKKLHYLAFPNYLDGNFIFLIGSMSQSFLLISNTCAHIRKIYNLSGDREIMKWRSPDTCNLVTAARK